MADVDDIRTRIDRLKTLRDSGVLSTSADGVMTSFRSIEDLDRTILRLERDAGIRLPRKRACSVFMGAR